MSEKHDQKTGEDSQERTARELIELLQELRIVIPGVQVLFAFLLTVPFSQGFTKLDALQRGVFFATLLCTAAATALLIAPSSHHRLLFRQGSESSGWSWATYSRSSGWPSSCRPWLGCCSSSPT